MTKTIPPSPQSPPSPRPEKREPDHEPQLTHDQRFWELYKLAFAALHAQFERPDEDGYARFSGGAEEVERSKTLANRAWNSALYAVALFEDDEEAINQFNNEVASDEDEEDEP